MTKDEERARDFIRELFESCYMDNPSSIDESIISKMLLELIGEIRVEAVERVQKLRTACITNCSTYYESGFRDGCSNAIAVITGKEPTK